MRFQKNSVKLTAAAALPLLVAVNAQAEAIDTQDIPGLSYSAQTSRETWKTVMYVSAALLLIGLASDESTLVLLGGAGVLVALAQTNGNMYRPSMTGFELKRSGAISLGLKPTSQTWYSSTMPKFNPSMVVQATFKF